MSGRVSFAVTTQSPDLRALHSMRRPVRAPRAGGSRTRRGRQRLRLRLADARRAGTRPRGVERSSTPRGRLCGGGHRPSAADRASNRYAWPHPSPFTGDAGAGRDRHSRPMRSPGEGLFGVVHPRTDRLPAGRDEHGDAPSMRAPLVGEVVGRDADSCVLALSGELSQGSVESATNAVSKALIDEGRVMVTCRACA